MSLTFTIINSNIQTNSIVGDVSVLPRKKASVNAQVQSSTVPGRHNANVVVDTDGTIAVYHNTENVNALLASIMYICQ